MLLFCLAAIFLLALVLYFILPVLLRAEVAAPADSAMRDIYQQQFAELEQELQQGLLDATQYSAAKLELERRLLQEVAFTNSDATKKIGSSLPEPKLALALALGLPLCALLLYLKLGSPATLLPADDMAAANNQQMMGQDFSALLAGLQHKLQQHPDDGAGWALLARSYVELQQYAQAVDAYAQATRIVSDDPQLLADYADTLAVVQGGQLAGKPEQLALQALKLDARHELALRLAANAAFERQDYTVAITYWQRLLQVLPADSELLPEVNAALQQARKLAVPAAK